MYPQKINPFKHEYFLGYINQVLPSLVKVHFPSSVLLNGFTHYGQEFNGGLVGSFVVIEGEVHGYLGRIIELGLPESERLSLSERAFQNRDFHPIGKIEILLSFDLYNPFNVKKGINSSPNIGAKVFVCSGEFVQEYLSRFGVKPDEQIITYEIGSLVSNPTTKVQVNLQSLFGRHCAVVGTTGGGKSYTVSKLVETLIKSNNKTILIDATGEYSCFDQLVDCTTCSLSVDYNFNYKNLSVADLFIMFRPGGQVQQPLLLEAINSLKLVHIIDRDKSKFTITENGNICIYKFNGKNGEELSIDVEDGCLIKKGKETLPFNRLCAIYSVELNDVTKTNFNIQKLTRQINNECYQIFGTAWNSNIDARNQGNASSLILRIHQALSDIEFKKTFGFDNAVKLDVIDAINTFIDPSIRKKILRLNFESVPFTFQIREIVANAIGSFLLKQARAGIFDSKRNSDNRPIVVIIDEAHQFINKAVKDEYFENIKLDAFDSIAKECRKYGLFLCIATQMPRDIPQGTLSQMGTFIVHRLINHSDKEAISNACSSANKSTLDFLPILGEGEAVITGVDFAMPIIMKFALPQNPPRSTTPLLNNITVFP